MFLLFYFRFTKTTQYVIPLEYLDKLKVIYIKRKKFLIPVQTLKYLEWRYGNNWKIPNKNWRLTDGNMVILNNLKVFLHFYKSSKTFIKCKKKYILPILPKRPKRSIFYFNKAELKKIKNTKVKPERY